MSKKLQKELLELSVKVANKCKINSYSSITGTIELSGEVQVPYNFKCEALHPGTFKGYTIEEMEILKAKDTIFQSQGNYHNYEINKDHKSQYYEESSVSDIVGKVTNAEYNSNLKAYILEGTVYDKEIALKIANGVIKYVSLRIKPGKVDFIDGMKFARNLTFEELSFVRAPGDPDAKIL